MWREDAQEEMMRWAIGGVVVVALSGWLASTEARERPLDELPKDVWDLAFVWTEPVKQVVRETRRFDPVSGLWFGLLEGSVKSVERTAGMLLSEDDKRRGPARDRDNPLFRYSF